MSAEWRGRGAGLEAEEDGGLCGFGLSWCALLGELFVETIESAVVAVLEFGDGAGAGALFEFDLRLWLLLCCGFFFERLC